MRSPGHLLAAVRQVAAGDHRILVEDIDVRLATPRLRGTTFFGSAWVWSNATEEAETLSFDPSMQVVAIPYSAFYDVPRGRAHRSRRFYGDRLFLVSPDGARSVPCRNADLGSEAR